MADVEARPITIPANGWTFSGFEWGPAEGRTVLLLHGFPQTSTSWGQVAARLAAAGLHPVAVDQRGYSPGARPSAVAAYAMPELVADVLAVIDALGGPLDLVGHDWGGVVGWQVAARHPDSLRTWTAVSTANPLALNEVLAVDAGQRARFGYIRTFRQPGIAEDVLLADDAARLRQLYGPTVSRSRIEQDVEFFSQPGVLSLALNWYRAMSPDDTDGLGVVTVPTAYVWGTADVAFGRAAAERSERFVEAPYKFATLDGATHWLPDEAPEALAEVITRGVLGE